jgi:hypothetical protein
MSYCRLPSRRGPFRACLFALEPEQFLFQCAHESPGFARLPAAENA